MILVAYTAPVLAPVIGVKTIQNDKKNNNNSKKKKPAAQSTAVIVMDLRGKKKSHMFFCSSVSEDKLAFT